MAWLFGRGTLKAHWVVDEKSVCGSGKHFEKSDYPILNLKTFQCKKCLRILKGSGINE